MKDQSRLTAAGHVLFHVLTPFHIRYLHTCAALST